MDLRCWIGIHDLQWKFTAEGMCDQHLACTRCEYVEDRSRRVHHTFGSQWDYSTPGTCEQHTSCTRCHEVVDRRVEHQPLVWSFVADGLCEQTGTCPRCGYVESRMFHDLDDKCHCHRCSADVHDWVCIVCPTCDGEGGWEVEGGYGNNPKVSWVTCYRCNGEKGIFVCNRCKDERIAIDASA